MGNLLLLQIFECVTVVFETFIVYQYISGLFEKRHEQKNALLWYVLFCLGLILLSLFSREEFVLAIYTLVGVYALALGLYRTSVSSRIFAVFFFTAIMIGAEIFTSGLISEIWNIDLSDALEYGLPRVLSIVVAKLIQIFLVKISVSVANWKSSISSRDEQKLVLPLLLCQAFSIILAHNVFEICSEIHDDFEPITLFAMIGILYLNIIIFWYFDRIRAVYEYKSKNEAMERKIELQKQYYEVLEEHQQETDALWHDMKKHINLIKTLINNGQHEITSEYVQDLESQMIDKVKIIRTTHPVVSALLTEQLQRAKRANILFDIDVRLEDEMKMAPVELCVILGNLFDNAFEACAKLSCESEKRIKSSIVQRGSTLAIKIENAYDSTAIPKRHPGKHGLGLKNVRQAVNKYNGQFDIAKENGRFVVSIVIP